MPCCRKISRPARRLTTKTPRPRLPTTARRGAPTTTATVAAAGTTTTAAAAVADRPISSAASCVPCSAAEKRKQPKHPGRLRVGRPFRSTDRSSSQSGRARAELRTTNRPDARLTLDLNKKSQEKNQAKDEVGAV